LSRQGTDSATDAVVGIASSVREAPAILSAAVRHGAQRARNCENHGLAVTIRALQGRPGKDYPRCPAGARRVVPCPLSARP